MEPHKRKIMKKIMGRAPTVTWADSSFNHRKGGCAKTEGLTRGHLVKGLGMPSCAEIRENCLCLGDTCPQHIAQTICYTSEMCMSCNRKCMSVYVILNGGVGKFQPHMSAQIE